MKNQNPETVVKSIRLEKSLCEKIQELADKGQRDFTKQVRFMLLNYINMMEQK